MSKNTIVLSADLIKILNKASDNKIYGSVEIYFEGGTITQITQRIINKIAHSQKTHKKKFNNSKENSIHLNNTPKLKNDQPEITSVSRSV